MEYIAHRRFKQKAACGIEMNIPALSVFKTMGGFIATEDGKAICRPTSESGQKYFAVNDDGNGLERGKLTYAIAFAKRKIKCNNGFVFRFSDQDQETLLSKWKKFLVPDSEFILFNNDFFHADIETLKQIAKDVNIKVKE